MDAGDVAGRDPRAGDYGPAFRRLVFSGGGTRCFWHGGFAAVAAGPLALRPEEVTGVSGGALSASAFLSGRERKLLAVMGAAFEGREHNHATTLREIQEDGLTPHQRIYGEVVREVIDAEAMEAIASGPAFRVLLAHPPSRRFARWSTFPLMAAYLADLAIFSTPHVRLPRMLGAETCLADARQAARDGTLQDLICSAAVIPPVFNIEGWNGRKVIDGGMTSKAPVPEEGSGRTLILLTRRFRNVPFHPERTYVQPSHEVPADKIDFTSRAKIERTWAQGEEDGRAFLRALQTLPATGAA